MKKFNKALLLLLLVSFIGIPNVNASFDWRTDPKKPSVCYRHKTNGFIYTLTQGSKKEENLKNAGYEKVKCNTKPKKECFRCSPGNTYRMMNPVEAASPSAQCVQAEESKCYKKSDKKPFECTDEDITAKLLSVSRSGNKVVNQIQLYDYKKRKYRDYYPSVFKISINGKIYDDVYCIDPGTKSAGAGSNICCTEMDDSDPGLFYIMDYAKENGVDKQIIQMAMRFYAVYNQEIKYNDSPGLQPFVFYLFQRNGTPLPPGMQIPDAWIKSDDPKAQSYIEAAYTLGTKGTGAHLNYQKGDGDGSKNDINKAIITVKDENPKAKTATLHIRFAKNTANVAKLQCDDGCSIVGPTTVPVGTLELDVNIKLLKKDCDFVFKVLAKTSGYYQCSAGEGYQTYYLKADDEEGPIGILDGKLECAECEIPGHSTTMPEQLGAPPVSKLQGDNCCDGGLLEISEPILQELFSRDECLEVDSYILKKGAAQYKDSTVEGSYTSGDIDRNYCEFYCNERTTAEIPGPIQGATNGMFFELEKKNMSYVVGSVTTAGSMINGYKRCRIRIKYYEWLKKYMQQIDNEIKYYNDYQLDKTWYELYEDAKKTQTLRSGRWTMYCDNITDTKYCGCKHTKDGRTWYTQESITSKTKRWEPKYYDFSYYRWEFEHYDDPKYTEYFKVMLDEKGINKKYGFYEDVIMIDDKIKTTNDHTQYSMFGHDSSEGNHHMIWYKNDALSDEHFSFDEIHNHDIAGTEQTLTCDGCSVTTKPTRWSCYIKAENDLGTDYGLTNNPIIGPGGAGENRYEAENYVPNKAAEKGDIRLNPNTTSKGYVDEDLNKAFPQIKEKVEEYDADKYSIATKEAKTLENKLFVCTNYFAQYAGTDVDARFTFEPESSFSYTQVYLDDYGSLTKSDTDIAFTKTCDKDMVEVQTPDLYKHSKGTEYVGVRDGNDHLNDPNYSALFEKNESKMWDFSCYPPVNGIVDMVYPGEYEEPPCNKTIASGFLGKSARVKNEHKKKLDKEYFTSTSFTQDARYHKWCYWEEASDEKHTLAQYGDVSYDTFNFTSHDMQYEVYLTTLEGHYETHWGLVNLGADGKFDEFLEETEDTCNGETGGSEGYSARSCWIEVHHGIVHTGKCTGKAVNTTEPCEVNSGSEGYVLYDFRVVDPKNLFPECTGDPGSCYDGMDETTRHGYNWLKEDIGVERINQVQSMDVYDIKNLTYSYILTSSDMKNIKQYNQKQIDDKQGGYSDFNLVCKNDCNIDLSGGGMHTVGGGKTLASDKSCSKCESEFVSKYSATNWANKSKGIADVRNDW